MNLTFFQDDAFPSVQVEKMDEADYGSKEFRSTVENGLSKMEWAALVMASHLVHRVPSVLEDDQRREMIVQAAVSIAEKVLTEVESRRRFLFNEKREKDRMRKSEEDEG